jgi:cytidyltransferase-like protein
MSNTHAKTIAQYRFPLDWTSEEVQTWLKIAKQVQQAKDEYKTVVFATGVFDLFHQEHQRFLEKARAAGNFLVVGIETDIRVREMKGPERPIDPQEKRAHNVWQSGVVDEVVVLPEAFNQPEHHRSLIGLLRPHILAVSSHSPYLEAKRKLMELFGGELRIVHQFNPEVSTTKLIEAHQSGSGPSSNV